MIDADIERLLCDFDTIFNGFSRKMISWRIPTMLETHATKGNYRDFFVGLTKATVFHPEIMEEPSKGSKKILETTTKFQYSILEQ